MPVACFPLLVVRMTEIGEIRGKLLRTHARASCIRPAVPYHGPEMSILEKVGNTPLRVIDGIYVKLECSNPGGSVKDRIAKFILEEAARRGDLKPGDTVVEATSGNTGIAVSIMAREMGYKAKIFMPEHMSAERVQMIQALGAEVHLTPREGGFERPIEIRDTYKGKPGYFVPDQFANPDNSRCHKTTTGTEIAQQLRDLGVEKLDAFVAGVGTGGTLMGVAEALREAFGPVHVVAVEPEESNVMSGGPAGEHGIQGIGDGFIPDLVDMKTVDEVSCVSTTEALEAAKNIRRDHGFCVGVSAGANTVSARRLIDRGAVSVATLWPDCADRYVSFGLEAPFSEGVTCPLKEVCGARSLELLADS